MSLSTASKVTSPRYQVALQLSHDRLQKLNDAAKVMGCSRHRLMLTAIDKGLPLIIAEAARPPTAIPAVRLPAVTLPKA